MFRGFWTFALGVYAGVYLSQNYEVPKVDDPQSIIKKIKEYADSHRKD